MSSCKFVALFWVEESAFSVQSTHTICVPRKEAWEYKPGDRVQAKFSGKLYTADVISISDDKKALNVEGNSYVEKYKARKERKLNSLTETARQKKGKTAAIPSNPVQDSVRDALKKDALLKARQEKAQKAEALKRSKERVLEEMDVLLDFPFSPETQTSEDEETNFEDVPTNSKGHPTMAVKQPRKRRVDEEDSHPCSKCCLLEDELEKKNKYIKKLEEQLESLQSTRSMSPSTSTPPPASCFERPKPGYYPKGCSSMKELLPQSHIYLYEDQLRRATNKISLSPDGRRDGSSCARYLLGIFFSKEDMSNKSLTSDGQYPCLNPYLVNGIIEYTMSISDSLRSRVTKVLRNKLSAFRCREKKQLSKVEAVL